MVLDSSARLIENTIADILGLAERGFGRREIARRTGLGPSTIYGILRGQHRMSLARAQAVQARRITYRSLRTVHLADGSTITGEPATARDASVIGHYGHAVQEALRGNLSALADPEFRRPVTLLMEDGQRVRVRLPTDPEFVREIGMRDEDIVEYLESETP